VRIIFKPLCIDNCAVDITGVSSRFWNLLFVCDKKMNPNDDRFGRETGYLILSQCVREWMIAMYWNCTHSESCTTGKTFFFVSYKLKYWPQVFLLNTSSHVIWIVPHHTVHQTTNTSRKFYAYWLHSIFPNRKKLVEKL